jgi:AcrR family transcriptional regulator
MKTTYDSILAASKQLFLERGYAATSMREIAEKSGIAKASIYHHFPDKERILLALLEETKESQRAMLAAIRAQPEPRPRIETAVRENLRFLAAMTGIVQTVRRELPGGRELSKKGFGRTIEEFRSLVAEAIVAGRESGLFRPIDPEKATTVLMAMLQGSVAAAMLGDGRIKSPEAQAESILDVFFNGVLA